MSLSGYRLVHERSGGPERKDRYYILVAQERRKIRRPWTAKATEATLFTSEQRDAILETLHARRRGWHVAQPFLVVVIRDNLALVVDDLYLWQMKSSPVWRAVSELELLAEATEP